MTALEIDFHDKIVSIDNHDPTGPGGSHTVFVFTNGWSASVVQGPYSYGGAEGRYEMGVLNPENNLDYENPVSPHDVVGWLTADGVTDLLRQLAFLTEEKLHEYKVETRRKEYIELLSGIAQAAKGLDEFDERIVSELPFDLRKASKALRLYFEVVADDNEEEDNA